MAITIELPVGMEERLRAKAPDVDFEREAKIGLAIELFRKETIGIFELGLILGMDRFDAEVFLARRKEYAQTLTKEEVWQDFLNLNKMLKDKGR